MPLVPLRLLLDHAAENNYGLAAFNVNNMEQIQSIMEAAKETDSPVIIQASRGARSYSQDAYLRHLMLAAAELYPNIPVAMHQDHGNSVKNCESAIDNGFTSVMMDGSLSEDGRLDFLELTAPAERFGVRDGQERPFNRSAAGELDGLVPVAALVGDHAVQDAALPVVLAAQRRLRLGSDRQVEQHF